MNHPPYLVIQDPVPGTHILLFRGDTITFTLSLSTAEHGEAWLRTNIGHAGISRGEIIREINQDAPLLGLDWFDIPMERIDDRNFRVTVPLVEVGNFQAKCLFLRKGDPAPIWPEGEDTVVNVEPADTCCANIIYNAFVRQFGPNKSGGAASDPSQESAVSSLSSAGYSVIPPSGTFRDLINELDFIVGELGCRIIQLLPVHPTPTTYPRMGHFGSPYASLSFTAVDPALAQFDPRSTPLEQFIELVDAVHERQAKIIIDIAINHTGWAASLHGTHPEWLLREGDGRIKVPGAWGVAWEDLTALDYTHRELWRYMADVFMTWCRRGVDGFRCDAGYMIPIPAWRYIVAVVRNHFPDTVFFLEGLGGKVSVTRDILNKANFNWAYSELFQNYDRNQIEHYIPEAMDISKSDGIMIHFSETHDNNRLAAQSEIYSRMRNALCALCSQNGGFGFTNGVEWYAKEKINVQESPSLNWGADVNQVDHIRRLNSMLKVHPALQDQTELGLIQEGPGNYIVLVRNHIPSGKRLLVIANLDEKRETPASWKPGNSGIEGLKFIDLLSGEKITIKGSGGLCSYTLSPGQSLCLTADLEDLKMVNDALSSNLTTPGRIERQKLKAKALDVFTFYEGPGDIGDYDPDLAANRLAEDPVAYCRSLKAFSEEPPVITWQWPNDSRREVMVPPGHFFMVKSRISFRAQIMGSYGFDIQEEGLPSSDGSFFALFSPMPVPETHLSCKLKLSVYEPGNCKHIEAPLLFLSTNQNTMVKRRFSRQDLSNKPLMFLGTNGLGSAMMANLSWGELESKYDALLSANLNPLYPEDRRIMFTRCRAWLVFQGYSREISNDCFESFSFDYDSKALWRYRVPTGQGKYILLDIGIEIMPGENALRIIFLRQETKDRRGRLADHEGVQLILRPDIEDRNFHETTKAYTGPEYQWPNSVKKNPSGFIFAPDQKRRLNMEISRGNFVWEPEWHYMVHRRRELERGLDPDSDLFSPGYFSVLLEGGEQIELTAKIGDAESKNIIHITEKTDPSPFENWPIEEALKRAMAHYIVKRGEFKTVIAGYPWFLDWGRDSLIFTRGLIRAKELDDAGAILRQFGQFEREGTISNMIRGKDTTNRDTSDAPLWFILACSDIVAAEGNCSFLETDCGGRTIAQVLHSIVNSLIKGTSNGICMDRESVLLFSPAHFTWMDTNNPAGTPREGYPIEIQALWYNALSFMALIEPDKEGNGWGAMASQVKSSIGNLFMLDKEGYLSDCLHGKPGTPASRAIPDDALRPNQLFAITLDAIADTELSRRIASACMELLVPGAIRSLADRPVRYPIPVVQWGRAINDPHNPYQGRYEGNEDWQRKPAYHNGTAWTWLFPTFCEAWAKIYGDSGRKTAMAWLSSSVDLINSGCLGHVPEILDGDFPHRHRGCYAQAWGVSELFRVFSILTG